MRVAKEKHPFGIAQPVVSLRKISLLPCWVRKARDIHKRFRVAWWRVPMVFEGKFCAKP